MTGDQHHFIYVEFVFLIVDFPADRDDAESLPNFRVGLSIGKQDRRRALDRQDFQDNSGSEWAVWAGLVHINKSVIQECL